MAVTSPAELQTAYQKPFLLDEAVLPIGAIDLVPIHELRGNAKMGSLFGLGGMAVNVKLWEPINSADFRHKVRVGIDAGWGGPPSAYENLGKALAERGISAFAVGDGRSFGWVGDFNWQNYTKVAEISSKVAHMSMKIVDRLTGGPQAYIRYGHSRGAQTATDAAGFDADKVIGVITDGSCGAEDHDFGESWDRTLQISQGELREKASTLIRNAPPRLLLDVPYHIFRNFPRTIAEGVDAGTTQLRDRWIVLREELGKKIVAVQSRKDVYSPVEAVMRDNGDVLNAIIVRDNPESGHFDPIHDYEGTAHIIIKVIDEWMASNNQAAESEIAVAA